MTEEHQHRTKCCVDLETPFLPDKQGCKAKVRPVCDTCSCCPHAKEVTTDGVKNPEDGKMYEEHMFGRGKGIRWNAKQQCCCGFMVFLFIYVVIFGIIQWLCFHFATENCGSLPDDYNFPGGGHGKTTGGPEKNLLPRNALIVGREPSMYGEAFDVFNSTNEGQMVSAPVGTWFRTWGPWFWTYTYQDTLNSKGTVYMRPTVLGMTGAMSELKVMRCDGEGEVLKFTEGTAVMGNMMREFFRTNTGRVLKMLVNGEIVAVAEETFHGQKSATFRTVDEGKKDTIGSCILRGVNGQGFNEWFLKNDWDGPLPFYMTSSVAANYAFKIKNEVGGPKTPSEFAALIGHMLTPAKDRHADAKQSKDITTP